MTHRIHPVAWPGLSITAPLWAPWLLLKNARFARSKEQAHRRNEQRLRDATPLGLPHATSLEITVLVDERARPGFLGQEGVSYILKTEFGKLLMDVGFGPASGVLSHNAARLDFSWEGIAGLAISHLHGDHMGGLAAARARTVALPGELAPDRPGIPCFLPEAAHTPRFEPVILDKPRPLAAGIGSTGPLSRSLFFLGPVEEQALLVRLKDRGLVVITGCGHPGLKLILGMARRLTNDPIYAVAGGLHFPITTGRGHYPGFEAQMLFGTGRPPWRRITNDDLSDAIDILREAHVRRLLLSAHDTCDHAIARFTNELDADVDVLSAGATYQLP